MAKQTKKTEKPTLPPQEALYQAISLCRKAGALTMGFDAVEDACVKGKAWLVMTASDASAKTVQRLNYAVGDLVDVITMPLTQDRLAAISRKAAEKGVPCEVVAEHADAIWKGVLACAVRHDVSFIVMASRGLGSIGSFLLGSETQKVLHQVDRPVLIVR